jgi:hypothetical protein
MTTSTPDPVQLDSTSLAAAAYDRRGGKLRLDFRDGTGYRYSGVGFGLYLELLCAPSKGLFFNRFIRGHFPHAKLPPEN